MTESALLKDFRRTAANATQGCIVLEKPDLLKQIVERNGAKDTTIRETATMELSGLRSRPSQYNPGNEIPEERRHIVFAVHGKRIMNELISSPVNLKEGYFHRVFCLVDVSHIAQHIATDKESFHGNWQTNQTRQAAQKFFQEFLSEQGLLGRDISKPQTAEIVNEFTKELDTSFKQLVDSVDENDLMTLIYTIQRTTIFTKRYGTNWSRIRLIGDCGRGFTLNMEVIRTS